MRTLFMLFILVSAFAKAYSQENSSSATERIICYYDVSYSMRSRNLPAETQFLNTYFQEHPNAEVQLVQMSSSLEETTSFLIKNGDWEVLRETISGLEFDGASAFSNIDFNLEVDQFILITDGEQSISKLPKAQGTPITILNTVSEDNGVLRWLGASSGGTYKELSTNSITTESNSVTRVKRILNPQKSQPQKSTSSELDELTITAIDDTRDRLEYNTIDIGGVKYNKKKLGYSVQKITEKEISDQDTDVQQAVKGQFAGLEIANDAATTNVDLSQFKGRHKGMTILGDQTGLVVIDGVPQSKSNSGSTSGLPGSTAVTSHIDPANVKSVVYLKGLAATNRYGTLGKGGVIEIITKSASGGTRTPKKKKALGTTPTYTGTAAIKSDLPKTDYMNALSRSKGINEALSIYLTYRDQYGDTPGYFLNVARYFKGWNQPEITERILANVTEVAQNELATLRALSYLYEEARNYPKLVELTEHIVTIAPESAQVYLDLARAYHRAGNFKKSLDTYNKVVSPSGLSGVNFSGIKETAVEEYKQFVTASRSILPTAKILQTYKSLQPQKLKKRIVFEYSTPEALFDLKIINPQNRFFTWSHTTAGDQGRLSKEKQQGFCQEEFFLTETDKGQWRFNVINYGMANKKRLEHTFLRITVFTNWGSTNQTKLVKVVQLSEVDKEEQILSLRI